ncbi:MAG: DinB family protein [Phycisphaerales bacterium]
MNADALIDRMARFPATLRAAVGEVATDDARWRPDASSWAIVEIVSHIADEETEDFGIRARMTLEDPAKPWPPIDAEAAAVSRRYLERDLGEQLDAFESARADSVTWLRSLPAGAPWSNAYEHPSIGTIRAGDILAAWCAHDALHLRQIAKRLYQLTVRDAGQHHTRYAGDWTA